MSRVFLLLIFFFLHDTHKLNVCDIIIKKKVRTSFKTSPLIYDGMSRLKVTDEHIEQ